MRLIPCSMCTHTLHFHLKCIHQSKGILINYLDQPLNLENEHISVGCFAFLNCFFFFLIFRSCFTFQFIVVVLAVWHFPRKNLTTIYVYDFTTHFMLDPEHCTFQKKKTNTINEKNRDEELNGC